MDKFLYAEINIFGIIIIIIMLCNQIMGTEKTIQQKIFNSLLITIIAILVFDAGMWIVDGMTFKNAAKVNLFFSTGYYLLQDIAPYIWLLYIEFIISNDVKKLKKTALIFLIPLFIYEIIIISNIWNGQIFIIDRNNIYNRESYIYIPLILVCFYFAVTTYKIYKKIKSTTDENEIRMMFYLESFIILPISATIIQIIYAGASVIWVSVLISLLIIFINVQNKQILTDALTGLNNRIQFDKYINALIKDIKNNEQICLVIIDIDKFKSINDNFGHAEGDKALIYTSKILMKSCKNKKIFISRYGGDEFLLIYKVKDISQLDELIKDIYFILDEFNMSEGLPYKIQLSIGKSVWDSNEFSSVNDLFIKADNSMYEEKKKKKNL